MPYFSFLSLILGNIVLFDIYMEGPCMFGFFFPQGKWDVPLPKVKAVGEDEVFKVIRTGKSKRECKS